MQGSALPVWSEQQQPRWLLRQFCGQCEADLSHTCINQTMYVSHEWQEHDRMLKPSITGLHQWCARQVNANGLDLMNSSCRRLQASQHYSPSLPDNPISIHSVEKLKIIVMSPRNIGRDQKSAYLNINAIVDEGGSHHRCIVSVQARECIVRTKVTTCNVDGWLSLSTRTGDEVRAQAAPFFMAFVTAIAKLRRNII